jgi:hypothetical protein
MLTDRQREVLHIVYEDVKNGRDWTERALTHGGASEISWDEMQWACGIEEQALLTRIEAMRVVDRAAQTCGCMGVPCSLHSNA